MFCHFCEYFLLEHFGIFCGIYGDNIRINSLSFDRMRVADNCRFDNIRMHIDSIFYFCRSESVATHFDDIIYSSCDLIIPILVSSCTISCKVESWIHREIGVFTSLMISVGGTNNSRPWKTNTQVS